MKHDRSAGSGSTPTGFDVLFSSFQLNGVTLPNRVVMPPMTRSRSPHGAPTTEMADYYRRRAENGVGLIITEGVGVDRPASLNEPDIPRFYGADALEGWAQVLRQVHAAGGRIAPELWHVGSKRSRVAPDWAPEGGYESPSGFSPSGRPEGKPMSEADVADTIDAFVRAAADAERLGFDGIDLHGAHNYLIAQFFTDQTNQRGDRFGGRSLVERSRFAIEIVKGIRAVVHPGFPIILRLSLSQPTSHHSSLVDTPLELERWLTSFADAGVDAFDLSQARYSDPIFPAIDPDLSFAGWAKKLTGRASIAVGSVGLSLDTYATFSGETARVRPLDDMLARLAREEFDLVAVGRPLLQDPAWLQKIRQGRYAELSDVPAQALDILY